MRTRKFGELDPATGRKWGGSPLTHWRALRRGIEAGVVDVPCGECSACCRSGVAIYEDDGAEVPKRADGACVHLDEAGWCDRHDSRPRPPGWARHQTTWVSMSQVGRPSTPRRMTRSSAPSVSARSTPRHIPDADRSWVEPSLVR